MANNIAFQAMGKTIQLTANSSTPTNAVLVSDSPSSQYRLVNHAGNPVYVWISPGTNPINVAVPTGTAQYAHVVPPNSSTVITSAQCSPTANVRVSVICEAGTPELYVTPGEGL